MLITCPECSHSVSDKAISCPSCGYPIKLSTPVQTPVYEAIAKPQRKKKVKKYKKLPNGFGSIKKLSGNRKKPYAAYPSAKGFTINGSPILGPAIGYFEDWHSAYDALKEYHRNPYDIDKARVTFEEVYKMYFEDKYVKNQKRKLSISSANSTNAAYRNCSAIHNKIEQNRCAMACQGCGIAIFYFL